MPVSEKAKKIVKERSHGYCELLHHYPTPGTQIVHSTHQGMGGAEEGAECNQPRKLLYGCSHCHDLIDGRLGAPWGIAEIDLDEGILEIIDAEGRRVDHSRIFFHSWPQWKEAERRYATLGKAARQLRLAQWIVAREFAWFKEGTKDSRKKGIERWRVAEEANSIWSFGALLGFTASQVKRYDRIGRWGVESGLRRLLAGLDLEVMDALRKASEEDLIELMGIAQHGKPADFYEEIDARRQKGKSKRQFWVASGEIRSEKAIKKEDVKLELGEKLIRGSLVIGGEDIKEGKDED